VQALVGELENVAFRSWPAAEVKDLDGWRLRSMVGVTRRANSVWTCASAGPSSMEERIATVESFYRDRGGIARFQLSPASLPAELDTALESRGYAIDAPTSIQLTTADRLKDLAPAEATVRVEATLSETWFEISARRGRYREMQAAYRGLLERLAGRALYALAELHSEPAAVGLGVLDGRWLGVFSMLTLESHRRRGLGRAVLGGITKAALARGANRVYLQVERDNPAGLALYGGCGFRELYGYHYRARELG
jgi:N-acetylglutamate synthase